MKFNEAKKLFETARNKNLGKPLPGREGRTRLVKAEFNAFAVQYCNTLVVTIHQNGTYTLNQDGWNTKTSRDRISQYAPIFLGTYCGVQYFTASGSRKGSRKVWIYSDGIKVNSKGFPVDKKIRAKGKKLGELFKAIGKEYRKKRYAESKAYKAALKAEWEKFKVGQIVENRFNERGLVLDCRAKNFLIEVVNFNDWVKYLYPASGLQIISQPETEEAEAKQAQPVK